MSALSKVKSPAFLSNCARPTRIAFIKIRPTCSGTSTKLGSAHRNVRRLPRYCYWIPKDIATVPILVTQPIFW